ncbi:MAG: LysR family transcriptional regulator [Bacteroidetes bacterium]|nr:LysR family transcriptional regulator [Bacteroidota bacterium]
MFDFRLKVFHTVAKRLNFTKAAEELFITQPAVTKHIHEIETYFKTQLFHRNGTKIALTEAGKILLKHSEELFSIYREMETDMAALNRNLRGTIKIGASTTVAQYILPKYLASFRKRFSDISVELITGNTEHIENFLLENKIDFGIIEGQSKRKQLKYSRFLKDELVLCTRYGNPLTKKRTISLNELPRLPLVVREYGSGSLEVVNTALKKAGIKIAHLQKEMILESSESIKSYLVGSDCFAFLSIHSVLNELNNKQLAIVDIKNFSIERYFYFVRQQGESNKMNEMVIRHLLSDNLK